MEQPQNSLDHHVAGGPIVRGMSIQSVYADIHCYDVPSSRDFYVQLLALEVAWESDWYVALVAPGAPDAQLALVAAGHDSVPAAYQLRPAGVLISFEVSDATAVYERAVDLGVEIAQELRDEEFGQRHFMAVDPDGLLVDVIQTLFVPEQES